jgi:hypothetical protein
MMKVKTMETRDNRVMKEELTIRQVDIKMERQLQAVRLHHRHITLRKNHLTIDGDRPQQILKMEAAMVETTQLEIVAEAVVHPEVDNLTDKASTFLNETETMITENHLQMVITEEITKNKG